MGDLRDERSWVAIELTPLGETKAIEGTLEASLRRDLRLDDDHPIFVPIALYRRDGRVIPIHLMEGYVFVATGLDEVAYFALEKQPYVSQVMSTQQGRHKFRCLSVITNAQVEAMRKKLREMVTAEIPLRSKVAVLDGAYRGLDGTVVGFEDDHAFVRITLRSLDLVATVPRVFLEEIEGE